MAKTKKHKVFISYHVEDQACKGFVEIMRIHCGQVGQHQLTVIVPLDEIRRRIRDDFIAATGSADRKAAPRARGLGNRSLGTRK